MDLSKEFEIKSAPNGGFAVLEGFDISRGPSGRNPLIAAFTTPADMITWLAEQYGVDTVVTVNKVTENLCKDEGCDHHGIPHECVNWIAWSGGECPVDERTRVQIKFRDGSEGPIFHAKAWDWSHREEPLCARDIVAYRVVTP